MMGSFCGPLGWKIRVHGRIDTGPWSSRPCRDLDKNELIPTNHRNSISSSHAAGVSMSTSAVSSTAAASSTSLSSFNRRRSVIAFRAPTPRCRSLPWNLLSSSSSHSPLTPVSAVASAGGGGEAVSGKKLHIFDAEEDLAASLADYTSQLSAKFAAERGAFTVVLSGGSLVKSLRKLAEPPYLEAVDWNKWHVFWVDERVVPKDHTDSNYKLASDGLLSKVPIPTGQVYAINDALSAEGASHDYETRLKQLVKNGVIEMSSVTGFPKFDLMLMGMGPDGHVASLFPGHPVVNENKKWVTFVKQGFSKATTGENHIYFPCDQFVCICCTCGNRCRKGRRSS